MKGKLRRAIGAMATWFGFGRYHLVSIDRYEGRVNSHGLYQTEHAATMEVERLLRRGGFSIYEDVVIYNGWTHDSIHLVRAADPGLYRIRMSASTPEACA